MNGLPEWRNTTGMSRLIEVMKERRLPQTERRLFALGFIAGWQERAIAEPGMVTITREHYADIEQRAALWDVHHGGGDPR